MIIHFSYHNTKEKNLYTPYGDVRWKGYDITNIECLLFILKKLRDSPSTVVLYFTVCGRRRVLARNVFTFENFLIKDRRSLFHRQT